MKLLKLKILLLQISMIFCFSVKGENLCIKRSLKLLVMGDSQTGATWSSSYFGHFLQQCLKNKYPAQNEFLILGAGGSTPGSWNKKNGIREVTIVERDVKKETRKLGKGRDVPLCKKYLPIILDVHQAEKVFFYFGDNYLRENHSQKILSQSQDFIKTVQEKGLKKESCYFMGPTFEMEVADHRNVASKNFENSMRIEKILREAVSDKCQFLSGMDLMKSSTTFNLATSKLKRVLIPNRSGCAGKASNDNVHVCGLAAQELAQKVCSIL